MNKNREDMLRKVMGTENYDLDMEIKRLRLKDTEDAADRLIEIMNNYPGWIGFEAARTLIKKKSKKINSAYKKIITDSDLEFLIRMNILETLWERSKKNENAKLVFIECLKIEWEKERKTYSLINYILHGIEHYIKYDVLEKEIVDGLVEFLLNMYNQIEFDSLELKSLLGIFGHLKLEKAVLLIIEKKHPSAGIRYERFIAIEKIGINSVTNILLNDSKSKNRKNAAIFLGDIPRNILPFHALGIKPQIVESDLVRLEIVNALRKSIESESNLDVRKEAINSLKNYGRLAIDVIEVLEKIIKESDNRGLVIYAETAIQSIGKEVGYEYDSIDTKIITEIQKNREILEEIHIETKLLLYTQPLDILDNILTRIQDEIDFISKLQKSDEQEEIVNEYIENMKNFILEAPFYVDKLLEITLLKLKFKRDKDLREKLIDKFTKGMCKLSKTLTKIGLVNMSIIIIEKIIPGLIEKYPIYSKIIEEIVAATIG